MAILTKGQTFANADSVTSTKLNNLVDAAAFVAGASGTTDNTSLEVNGSGRLQVKDLGVTSAKIDNGAVTTVKIADSNVTTAKILDANVTTAKIADANVTPAKLSQPLTLATAQNSTSGTSIDFTGIPSWAKRITVTFNGCSTNGTSIVLIQLGDAGGIENTAYLSIGASISGPSVGIADFTTGFGTSSGQSAADAIAGSIVLTLQSGNTWTSTGLIRKANSSGGWTMGVKTLSDTLDRIRITTVNGTDTFDSGSVNIMYE